jgi:hypothetical protein
MVKAIEEGLAERKVDKEMEKEKEAEEAAEKEEVMEVTVTDEDAPVIEEGAVKPAGRPRRGATAVRPKKKD